MMNLVVEFLMTTKYLLYLTQLPTKYACFHFHFACIVILMLILLMQLSQVEILVQNHQLGSASITKRSSELRQALELLAELQYQYLQDKENEQLLQQHQQQQQLQLQQQQQLQVQQQQPQQKQTPRKSKSSASSSPQSSPQKPPSRRISSQSLHTLTPSQESKMNSSFESYKSDDNTPPSPVLVPPTPSPAPNFAFNSPSNTNKSSPRTKQPKPVNTPSPSHSTGRPLITTHTSYPTYPPASKPTSSPSRPSNSSSYFQKHSTSSQMVSKSSPRRTSPPNEKPSLSSSPPSIVPESPTARELAILNRELQMAVVTLQVWYFQYLIASVSYFIVQQNVSNLQAEKEQSQQIMVQMTQQINELQTHRDAKAEATIVALQVQVLRSPFCSHS